MEGRGMVYIYGRGPSTSPHASPSRNRLGQPLELCPRGSKKNGMLLLMERNLLIHVQNAINSSVE